MDKKKIVADNLFKITASSLKLNSILKSGNIGIIDIPCNREGFKNGIHIVVPVQVKKSPYLYLCYSLLQSDGRYRDFEYQIDLDTTLCNYGGVKYWFRCPLPIGGCDRRVEVLYKVGDWFGCKKCFNLTYKSRNKRGPYGLGVIDLDMVCASRDPRNWKYYKGKPTRRLKRLIKMDEKFKKSLAIFNAKMDAKHKKKMEKMKKFMKKEGIDTDEEQGRKLDSSGLSAGDAPDCDVNAQDSQK